MMYMGALTNDTAASERYKVLNMSVDEIKSLFIKLNNLVLDNKPKDMVINTHICWGNYHSIYFWSGAYDAVAK